MNEMFLFNCLKLNGWTIETCNCLILAKRMQLWVNPSRGKCTLRGSGSYLWVYMLLTQIMVGRLHHSVLNYLHFEIQLLTLSSFHLHFIAIYRCCWKGNWSWMVIPAFSISSFPFSIVCSVIIMYSLYIYKWYCRLLINIFNSAKLLILFFVILRRFYVLKDDS